MPENKLKPCPFCGSNDIEIADISTEDEKYYMIQCNSCNASACFGDKSTTKKGAKNAWNRRSDNEM